MTEQTQIQQTIQDMLNLLSSCDDKSYQETCSQLYLMVNPPTAAKETSGEPARHSDTPEEMNTAQKINPALAQKELNSHYEQLCQLYDSRPDRHLGLVIARVLIVFHQDDNIAEKFSQLMFKLKDTSVLTAFGSDFTRNSGIYMAQYYRTHPSAELLEYIEYVTDHLMKIEYVLETLDCIIEMNDFRLLDKYINQENSLKMVYYINQCLLYSSDPENQLSKQNELFSLLLERQFYPLALDIAVIQSDSNKMDQLYERINTPETAYEVKLQFCLIVAEQNLDGSHYFTDDQKLQQVLRNQHKSKTFLRQVHALGLGLPKNPEDVLKRRDIEIDWGYFNGYTGTFLMNGFVHLGYQDDYLLNSHIERTGTNDEQAHPSESQVQLASTEAQTVSGPLPCIPEGNHLFFISGKAEQKTSLDTALGAATVGLLHMWSGYQQNFSFAQKYANSPDQWIRAGALLAYGISAHNCRTDAPFDFLLNLLGGQFHPYYDHLVRGPDGDIIDYKSDMLQETFSQCFNGTNLTNFQHTKVARNNETVEYQNSKEAFAVLAIGIAYMGTHNKHAEDLIITRLRLSSDKQVKDIPILEKNPRCFACLALGLVALGTGDTKVADVILRVMAGNSQSQRALRFFPLCCIGLALVFLKFANTAENQNKVEEFNSQLQDKLNQVVKPDSPTEKLVVKQEDNIQLSAYLQSMIVVFAYANQGNIQVIQDLMEAMTDSIQGRVASEEAENISKYDMNKQHVYGTDQDINTFVAPSGKPIVINNKTIWPGENLDPSPILVIGLGVLTGDDEILNQMVGRFAERILKYANINAQRAVPLLLALTSLSNPKPELIDDLSKLSMHMDQTMCYNSLIALGLIGCGTQNFKIAGALRHCIESKYYSEKDISHVLLGAQLAFGLLNAGKGALCIQKRSLSQLGSLLAVLSFVGPSAEVQQRTKCQIIYFLLACAMQPKVHSAIDKDGNDVSVAVRSGRAVEDLNASGPFRLTGFSLYKTPVMCGAGDMVSVVDDDHTAVWEGYKGVADHQVFVVRKSEETRKEDVLKKDGVYV